LKKNFNPEKLTPDMRMNVVLGRLGWIASVVRACLSNMSTPLLECILFLALENVTL
jgi:hypothetical protein